ncbi:MAG: putative capsular polysaccharide synthesis family protein [bacterium]
MKWGFIAPIKFMIQFSKIDDDLSIYKENKVIVFGSYNSYEVKEIFSLLKGFNIEVYAFCDSNENVQDDILDNGIKVIPLDEFKEMSNKNDVVVQLGISDQELEAQVVNQVKDFGYSNYIVTNEALNILVIIDKINYLDNPQSIATPICYKEHNQRIITRLKENFFNFAIKNKNKDLLLICSAAKTGNTTLTATFEKNNIDYFYARHRVEVLNYDAFKKYGSKIKIILGIREPISWNLSIMYQINADSRVSADLLKFVKEALSKPVFEGVDFEDLKTMEKFIPKFNDEFLNLMAYPFDKERGFSIIKDDNIEVFVYTLEKMNNIAKPLSDWVCEGNGNTPFEKWERANLAEDKWIAPNYKQAQKELKFSREYFEKCYSYPYVNHFYSEQDLQAFKQKWQNNIG